MSRPLSSATDFAHHSVRGPRERRRLRPTRTAPPSSRSGRKTIPTDKFLDVLQSPAYYAELYPDILPLTRKLYLQLRTQEASGMPGPNHPWTETRLDSEDNHARSSGLDKANDELRQSGGGGYRVDVGDLDVQTMPCDRSSSYNPPNGDKNHTIAPCPYGSKVRAQDTTVILGVEIKISLYLDFPTGGLGYRWEASSSRLSQSG